MLSRIGLGMVLWGLVAVAAAQEPQTQGSPQGNKPRATRAVVTEATPTPIAEQLPIGGEPPTQGAPPAKQPGATLPSVVNQVQPTPIADPVPPALKPTAEPVQPAPMPTPIADQVLAAPVSIAGVSAPFQGRFSLRGDAGDGVGYTRGFGYLEAMLPLKETRSSLFFTDLRLVNFFDENRLEGNAGLGYRWFSEPVHCVLGVNAFYDVRKSDDHLYQQLGLGVEALTPRCEFRANGYIIMGAAHRVVGPADFINLGAFNGNVVFQRRRTLEVARGGADFEIGGLLPFLDSITPRAYVGLYTYSAEGLQTANGVRGRLEAQLCRHASIHVQIQHDRVFDTTIGGGLAVHYGAPAYRAAGGCVSWEDVMRQRLVRSNIVLSQVPSVTQQLVPLPPPPAPPPPVEQEPDF